MTVQGSISPLLQVADLGLGTTAFQLVDRAFVELDELLGHRLGYLRGPPAELFDLLAGKCMIDVTDSVQ